MLSLGFGSVGSLDPKGAHFLKRVQFPMLNKSNLICLVKNLGICYVEFSMQKITKLRQAFEYTPTVLCIAQPGLVSLIFKS